MMQQTKIFLLTMLMISGIGTLTAITVQYLQNQYNIKITKTLIAEEAEDYLKNPPQPLTDREIVVKRDIWNQPLRYHVNIDEEKHCLQIVVSSNGTDELPETEDDITAERTDYNKSRIVGAWVARKGKEVVEGFKEGLKDERKFWEK
jgi:hypothetical protein